MEQLKIITDLSGNIDLEPIDIIFGFSQDCNIPVEKKSLMSIGAHHINACNTIKKYTDYYKIYFLPEEPQGIHSAESYSGILAIESTCNLIFGQCKYFNKWREDYYNSPKRIHTFTPFDEKYTFPSEDKTIPVYWTGTNNPRWPLIWDIKRIVGEFGGTTVDFRESAGISHEQKMILNGKSKISITYAVLYMKDIIQNSLSNLNLCEVFSEYQNSGYVPQMKTRVYEAAFSKSIILHLRDSWNVIEDWFIPEKEFIYYDNINDLRDKINEILKNYESYYHIAENAYNKAISNYTTKHYIDKYIIPNTKLEV